MSAADVPSRGRPPATSAAAIARTALELFVEQGCDATTLGQVADEALGAVVEAVQRLPTDLPWQAGVVQVVLASLIVPDDLAALPLTATAPSLWVHLVSSGAAAGDVIAQCSAPAPGLPRPTSCHGPSPTPPGPPPPVGSCGG